MQVVDFKALMVLKADVLEPTRAIRQSELGCLELNLSY